MWAGCGNRPLWFGILEWPYVGLALCGVGLLRVVLSLLFETGVAQVWHYVSVV